MLKQGRPIRIAVDGPAASGKGTVARTVARELGYAYVDTGTLYRTIGLLAKEAGLSLDDEAALAILASKLEVRFTWNGDELRIEVGTRDLTRWIRTEEMGRAASLVSRHAAVRSALLGLQRELAGRGGVVMDGRDIGSVVLPDAELKVYLDASLHERTERRLLEMRRRGVEGTYEGTYAEVERRDAADRNRPVAPLVRLPEAFYVDTTGLTASAAAALVLAEARLRGA